MALFLNHVSLLTESGAVFNAVYRRKWVAIVNCLVHLMAFLAAWSPTPLMALIISMLVTLVVLMYLQLVLHLVLVVVPILLLLIKVMHSKFQLADQLQHFS